MDEDARSTPHAYAASKVAQEHYAAAWVRQAGAAAVALRYHNVYGPWMPRDTPYSGVAAMFRSSLERGEPPRVFEDGGQMRDFVHVGDVAAGERRWRWRPSSAGHGFARLQRLLREPVWILDVAELVAEAPVGPDARGDRRLPAGRRAARGRLARTGRAELGFAAGVSPGEGLRGVRARARCG